MAIRLWEKIGTTDTKLWKDPTIYTKADIPGDITTLEAILALSDDAKTWIISQSRTLYQSISDFNDAVQDEVDKLKDILDYFDYVTKNTTITNYDGMWMTPEAVESVCGEDTGQEATLSIDGTNSTYWEHDVNEAHEIVYRIRPYLKKCSKIRLRLPTAVKAKLHNLTVHAAQSISGLSNNDNKVIDDISPVWIEQSWNEFVFDFKRRAKYLKLSGFGSENANDYIRIYEIDVWVETHEYD